MRNTFPDVPAEAGGLRNTFPDPPAFQGALRNTFPGVPVEKGSLRNTFPGAPDAAGALTFTSMKTYGWLVLGLSLAGCARRPVVVAPWPVVAAPYHAPRAVAVAEPAAGLVAPNLTPVGNERQAAVVAQKATAGGRPERVGGAHRRPSVRRLGRLATATPAGRPASHAADGLIYLLYFAIGALVLLVVPIIFAIAAPATILGGIGKVVLYLLGGFLLMTLLGSIGQNRTQRLREKARQQPAQ